MMTLDQWLSSQTVQLIGWTILHFLWQGIIVAAILALALLALRKRSANTRYFAACIAILLLAVFPLVTFYVITPQPAISLPLSTSVTVHSIDVSPIKLPSPSIIDQPDQVVSMAPPPQQPWYHQFIDSCERQMPWIVAAWLLGVAVLSCRLLAGIYAAHRIRRSACEPINDRWKQKLNDLAKRLRIRQSIDLFESTLTQVPVVVGHFRPAILLPVCALTGLTIEQLEAILAHELAHIRRYDYLINLLQTLVETLLFYHPAVWWISRKIRIERENCCDDLAISLCNDRLDYAQALLAMETLRQSKTQLALAANGGSLLERIRRLIAPAQKSSSRLSTSFSSVILLLMFFILMIGLHVSCRDTASTQPALPPTTTTAPVPKDLNAKIAELKFNKSTKEDVIRLFGEPIAYLWGIMALDKNNLPDRYIMGYPGNIQFCFMNGTLWEIRFENPGKFTYRNKLRVGSSLAEALEILGPPIKTVEGKISYMKNDYGEDNPQFEEGILYKDWNGRKCFQYYSRPDKGIRLFFYKEKISGLYLTPTRPIIPSMHHPAATENPHFFDNINEKVAKLDINKATRDDVIKVFGEPISYMWGEKVFDKNKLPDHYVMIYYDKFMAFIANNSVVELRFHQSGPYIYQNKLKIGSTLEDALKVLDQPPVETVVGQKNPYKEGILYKDIEGISGKHYYARPDKGIRLFFSNNKIIGLYLTRTEPRAYLKPGWKRYGFTSSSGDTNPKLDHYMSSVFRQISQQKPSTNESNTSTILLNAQLVSFPTSEETAVVTKILGRKEPLKESGAELVVTAEQTEELTKAFQGHRISSPEILLKNYGVGSVTVGQTIPVQLPNADQPDNKNAFEFPLGFSLTVKARIDDDHNSVSLVFEASESKLVKSQPAGQTNLQTTEILTGANIPDGQATLIKFPANKTVSHFVEYRKLVDPATNEKVVDLHEESVKNIDSKDSVFLLIKATIKK